MSLKYEPASEQVDGVLSNRESAAARKGVFCIEVSRASPLLCQVTPVILHGVVSPKVTPVILHGVISPDPLLLTSLSNRESAAARALHRGASRPFVTHKPGDE